MTATARTARKLSPADQAKAAARRAEREALVAKLDDFATHQACNGFEVTWAKLTGHYSERNSMLIILQCPEVTEVKAYKAWQAEGRQVRKGARASRSWPRPVPRSATATWSWPPTATPRPPGRAAGSSAGSRSLTSLRPTPQARR
jgi:DNA primase